MALVLKNTFWQFEDTAADTAPCFARPRASTDSFHGAGKPTESLSDQETQIGGEAADETEFLVTDDESAYSNEPAPADFERCAKENVRLLREGMTKAQRGGSSASSSCSSVPMMHGFFPNALPPMVSIIMVDPRQMRLEAEKARRKQHKEAKPAKDTRTTVMLRNLPREFSRDELLKLLDDAGFAGKYNFVYMPIDFVRQAGLGYAFINLVSTSVVQEFWAAFDGFSTWPENVECDKVCRVNWSSPHQGYAEHVQRYRNSPLMHQDVPDECRPVLLENGVRVAFPPPTKSLRAPRLRAARQRCPFWDQEQGEADGEAEHASEEQHTGSV